MLMNRLSETVTAIHSLCDKPIQAAVVLGSGLGSEVDQLPGATVIPYGQIPHFATSGVQGHAGNLVIVEPQPGFAVAYMQGRFHFYEGHPMEQVVYPIRVLRKLGAHTLLVSNAAGGINPSFQAGDLMIITDHLNLMGTNPLIGKNWDPLGPRFPDLSEPYSHRLIEVARTIAQEQGTTLVEGVYAGLTGPSYETPAEVRMLGKLGADAVGMSTVPEVIVANHMGMEVFGMSCITNLAAGISPHRLSHQEVMETGLRVKTKFWGLLQGLITHLASSPTPAQLVN
jgi:purine-nucleoside phosphorylase